MSENKYAVLAEANGAEVETWMYFIKYNGNEKALDYLQHQLTKIDMIILDDNVINELTEYIKYVKAQETQLKKIEIKKKKFKDTFFNKSNE